MANIFHIERADNKITLGTTGTTINIASHTASQSLALDASKNLVSVDLGAVYQPLDAVLTDLAALTAVADNEFIVGTGAGAYAHESGDTVRTSLGLAIGTNVQAWDASLDSIAALTYISDSFIKVTAEDTYAIRTIAEIKTDLSLNLVENTALSTWAGSGNITTVGALASGSIAAGFTEIATDYTAAKCTDATADNTAGNETSHADVVVDGDFASNGILNRTGAGVYSVLALGTDVQAYHANLAAIVGGTWTGANSITTLGTIATVGNITIANNGTIGQTAGPLLTFDDTNNFLEITGCKVGIGTDSPVSSLEIMSSANYNQLKLTRAKSEFAQRTGIISQQYAPAEEGVSILLCYASETENRIGFGGGSTDFNAATLIRFFTAANSATVFGTERMVIDSTGKVGIPTITNSIFTADGTLSLKEQAAADADTAAYGQIWVKNDAPNTLWFTDDAGTDLRIAPQYVNRDDPSAWDWTQATLTLNDTWNDLDLSSVVGANTALVHLRIWIKDNSANTHFSLRENGNSNIYNSSRLVTQVANIYIKEDCWVVCDSNGVIEYTGSTGLDEVDILIAGWTLL